MSDGASAVRFGLRANAGQFGLLMLINAFVGGMVGLERTVVPLVGTKEFGLLLNTVAVSFIISFGIVKACATSFREHSPTDMVASTSSWPAG